MSFLGSNVPRSKRLATADSGAAQRQTWAAVLTSGAFEGEGRAHLYLLDRFAFRPIVEARTLISQDGHSQSVQEKLSGAAKYVYDLR